MQHLRTTKLLMIACCLILATTHMACKKDAPKTKTKQPGIKTKQTAPVEQKKKQIPTWKGKLNAINYTVTMEPIKKNDMWFYKMSMIMDVPSDAPTLMLIVGQASMDNPATHPFKFEKKLKTKGVDIRSAYFSGGYKGKPYMLTPGKKHNFSYDYTTTGSKNPIAPKAGQTAEHRFCFIGLQNPKTDDYYNACVVTAIIDVDKDGQPKVTFEPVHKDGTLKPEPPVWDLTKNDINLKISPYKTKWESGRTSMFKRGLKNNTSLFFLPKKQWRKDPVTILHRPDELIVNNQRYTGYPKDAVLMLNTLTVSVDGKPLKGKTLTPDQLADAFPKKKKKDYNKLSGDTIYLDLQSNVSGSVNSSSGMGKKGSLQLSFSNGAGIEGKVNDGQFRYKHENAKTFTNYGKLKKGDYVRTSLHKVWVNDKVRKPSK